MKKQLKHLRDFKGRYRVLRKFNRLMKQMRTPLEQRSDELQKVATATLFYTRVSDMVNYVDIRTLFENPLKIEQ